ncbi:MAG: DUF4062 domain-containing protein [Clostridia bacterium]|nr:DUF4062 domain-containing protein [Clostridia bacterium]
MYTYFISSTGDLAEERKEVQLALTALKCKCLWMEHFRISDGTDGLKEIEKMIDESDRIIFLAGDNYGTEKRNSGKSWTQLEIEYAQKKKKRIFAVQLPSYRALKEKIQKKESIENDSLKQPLKQYNFVKSKLESLTDADLSKSKEDPLCDKNSIYYAVCIYHLGQIDDLNTEKEMEASIKAEAEEKKWLREHKYYDLRGRWYSVHTSNKDPEYLRIGTVNITQRFTMSEYRDLEASAVNFNVCIEDGRIVTENGLIVYDKTKLTSWKSDYEIYEKSKKVLGVFVATRAFKGSFKSAVVGKTNNQYGIHEFYINTSKEISDFLSGTFRNAADPEKDEVIAYHKAGNLYLFRDQKKRDEFVLNAVEDGDIII